MQNKLSKNVTNTFYYTGIPIKLDNSSLQGTRIIK